VVQSHAEVQMMYVGGEGEEEGSGMSIAIFLGERGGKEWP